MPTLKNRFSMIDKTERIVIDEYKPRYDIFVTNEQGHYLIASSTNETWAREIIVALSDRLNH